MQSQRGEKITNDKLNLYPKEIFGIVLAAAAALLCAAIDYLIKENDHEE